MSLEVWRSLVCLRFFATGGLLAGLLLVSAAAPVSAAAKGPGPGTGLSDASVLQLAQSTQETTAVPSDSAAAFQRGQDLSAEHCTRCHVVEDFNPYGGIGSTPSFKLLLSLKDWLERFETFFERQPHPVVVRMEGVSPWTEIPSNVVTFDMTADDLDDLVSYVTQMKARQ